MYLNLLLFAQYGFTNISMITEKFTTDPKFKSIFMNLFYSYT